MNPLDQLADIHTPTEVDWWPLAWGWWLLAAVILLAILGLALFLYKKYKFNGPRREAKLMLAHLDPASDTYCSDINTLLKRVVRHYVSPHVAAQYGQQWTDTLSQCCPPKLRAELTPVLIQLQTNLYAPEPMPLADKQKLQKAIQVWLGKAKLNHKSLLTTDVISTREVDHV
jgi:hypothetical protein